MSRTDWTDAQDPTVKACLTVPCELGGCSAKPDVHCKNLDGQPLPGGRIVHSYRQNKLIKGGQDPWEDS